MSIGLSKYQNKIFTKYNFDIILGNKNIVCKLGLSKPKNFNLAKT